MIDAVYWGVGILFTVAGLLVVYRIVRGPSILDRMIASDVLLTTLILVVGADMVYNGHTRTIPLMLVLSSTAIFATIAVARYVSKQDKATVLVPLGESPVASSANRPEPERRLADGVAGEADGHDRADGHDKAGGDAR